MVYGCAAIASQVVILAPWGQFQLHGRPSLERRYGSRGCLVTA